MSEGAPAALKEPGAGLVDLERELEALLVEYESLSRAWPKEPGAAPKPGPRGSYKKRGMTDVAGRS